MEITGKIEFIGKDEKVSDSFTKRDIVVTTDEQYPQQILIQFVQEKVDLLDKFAVGQKVTVSFNLRGRAWKNPQGETKYFNTLQGWRIKADESATAATPAPSNDLLPGEVESDLPF